MEYGIRDLKDLLYVLRKRSFVIMAIMTTCIAISLTLAFLLPKKYKSSAIMTIYNDYFHIPLIKGITYEATDGHELKIQRESLVRSALNNDFLDNLGEKFRLFKYGKDHRFHNGERQELLQKVEINALNDATYEFSFIADKPEDVFGIVSDIMRQIRYTLITERKRTLTGLRDAIRSNLETTSLKQKQTTDPSAANRPELLIQERFRLESEIAALSKQYTDKHPAVEKLVARVRVINSWLESLNNKGRPADSERAIKPLIGSGAIGAEVEVYADLSQKLNYLNIALELENTDQPGYLGMVQSPFIPYKPMWPKKGLFLIWGLLTGLIVSSFTVFISEYLSTGKREDVVRPVSDPPSESYVWN